MRIKEIEARLAAIKQEIEQRGDAMTAAEIDALEQETTQLTEERAGLIAAAEKRNGILDNIAKGAGIVSRSFQQNNGDDNAAPDDPFGTPEYRSAWLKNIRRLPLNDAEKRAFSNASGAGAEVIPTQTANEIISKVKTLAPMLNEVTLLHVKGAVKFAIEGTNNAAAIHTVMRDRRGESCSRLRQSWTKLTTISPSIATPSPTIRRKPKKSGATCGMESSTALAISASPALAILLA